MNFKKEMKKYFSILFNKKNNDHKRVISLLGGLMIYFCLGGYTIWGYLNVYVASYFHSFDPEFSLKNANVLLTLALSPLCFIPIFSIQFAEKVGFRNQIRFATILFSCSVILASYQTNFLIFLIFYGLGCSIAGGLSITPIIYTIWGFFPRSKGKITGYMFGMFGLTGTIIVPIISAYVNPNNLRAENKGGNMWFSKEVYEKVPDMLFLLGIFYFSWMFIGASLIHEPEKIDKRTNDFVEKTNSIKNIRQNDEENNILISQPNILCPNIKTGLLSKPFILIFFCSFFLALYSFYLHINFKSYGLIKINDDHFITIVAFLNGIGALTGRIMFGHILDRTSFKKLFFLLEILLGFFSFTFPLVSTYTYSYAFWIFFISCIDGGILCIIGPGLIHIFGFEVGSRLYPIKQTSFYVSMILVPILQLVLMKIFTYDQIFYIFGAGNVIAVGLASSIKEKYEWNN